MDTDIEEYLTTREQGMLDSVKKITVPRTVKEFKAANDKILSASLLRASIADKLLERVRENAKFSLRVYVELLSIKFTQERWYDGIEYVLWRAVVGGPRKKMSDEEVEKLRVLATEAGGWWQVSGTTDEPQFEEMDSWLMRYEDWINDN